MARTKSYRELIVWQKAMKLAQSAYRLIDELPRKEAFGLVAQLRRAAISVPSNIAEGHGRLTDSQFRHFLGNARGSLYELEMQFELARDLGYLDEMKVQSIMEQGWEVARLINGLITSLGEKNVIAPKRLAPLTVRSAANSANEGHRR